jgi:hypothetical protein
MAIPTTRDEFRGYCLRQLGDGVLQINISDDQVEDRIDEAFYVYRQFHMDATEQSYYKHAITPSTFHLTTSVSFRVGEEIVGQTSNAKCVVDSSYTPGGNTVIVYGESGSFVNGETLHGGQSGVDAVLSGAELGSFDKHEIVLPDEVIAVTKIFAPFDSRVNADILFDPQSQFNMSLMANFTSNSIIPYFIGRSYQQLLNDMFRGRPGIRFTRHTKTLHIDVNWYTNFVPHQYVIVQCYTALDPTDYPDVWSDRWLQRYATQLMKRQWGTNVSKYIGIQLPGGVQLDGKTMYEQADAEIKLLEEELKTTYQLPIDFTVG